MGTADAGQLIVGRNISRCTYQQMYCQVQGFFHLISRPVFAFLLVKIVMRGQELSVPVAGILAAVGGPFYYKSRPVFAFLLLKIEARKKQLQDVLYRAAGIPVFRFSACKNCNAGIARGLETVP